VSICGRVEIVVGVRFHTGEVLRFDLMDIDKLTEFLSRKILGKS
jgi:hypothetical protein